MNPPTPYQIVITDFKYLNRVNWQYLVLDEAQAIKSANSQRWKLLLEFKCRGRLLLSGNLDSLPPTRPLRIADPEGLDQWSQIPITLKRSWVWIRIPIKVKSRIRIRIEVKSWIRIRIKVMRIP
jgi:hypothetical protein